MLNFCDFIQVYVFSTNHHLKIGVFSEKEGVCAFMVSEYGNIQNAFTKGGAGVSVFFFFFFWGGGRGGGRGGGGGGGYFYPEQVY